MTITESKRHQLYKRLEDTLGTDDANTLMEHLPPVGWGDVATKADIEGLRAATKADIEVLRAATKADIEALRAATKADIEGLKVNVEGLRAATKADMAALEERMGLRLDKTIAEALHRQFVQMIASTAAMLGVMLSLAVTANQLLTG